MKKSVKSLLTLLLLLGVTLEMKAADVYLLTAQTINGIDGKYAVPNNHKLENTSGSNVYSLKITSMPEGGFLSLMKKTMTVRLTRAVFGITTGII